MLLHVVVHTSMLFFLSVISFSFRTKRVIYISVYSLTAGSPGILVAYKQTVNALPRLRGDLKHVT